MRPLEHGCATPDVEVEIETDAWSDACPGADDIVRRAARAALGDRRDGVLTVLLTDDDAVRELNARFRAIDAPTNVLAFPAARPPGGAPPETCLGDVALAFGVCEREARAQGKSLADHLCHLVIHGALHLLGYDHQDDDQATAMEALERELLGRLGVSDPYARDDIADDAPGEPHDVAKSAFPHG
jgi:probable rRNA maturation factor